MGANVLLTSLEVSLFVATVTVYLKLVPLPFPPVPHVAHSMVVAVMVCVLLALMARIVSAQLPLAISGLAPIALFLFVLVIRLVVLAILILIVDGVAKNKFVCLETAQDLTPLIPPCVASIFIVAILLNVSAMELVPARTEAVAQRVVTVFVCLLMAVSSVSWPWTVSEFWEEVPPATCVAATRATTPVWDVTRTPPATLWFATTLEFHLDLFVTTVECAEETARVATILVWPPRALSVRMPPLVLGVKPAIWQELVFRSTTTAVVVAK